MARMHSRRKGKSGSKRPLKQVASWAPYKEKEVEKEELIRIIRLQQVEDATFNIVGKKSIKTAIEAELITEDNVGHVQGIPFALTLL